MPSLLPTDRYGKAAYSFSFDGSSPYSVYFEATGHGENRLEQWSTGNLPRPYNVERFHHDTKNSWHLSKRVHLVQVEVNDGDGQAFSGIHFVATDVGVLEGTAEFPLDVEASMAEVTREFDQLLQKKSQALQSTLTKERAAQKQERGPTISRYHSERIDEPEGLSGAHLSFDTEKGVIRVIMIHRLVEKSVLEYRPSPAPPCPPGAPCMRFPGPSDKVTWYGAEMAAIYEIDRKGYVRLVKVEPPRRLVKARR
jgi:hypothetical protein